MSVKRSVQTARSRRDLQKAGEAFRDASRLLNALPHPVLAVAPDGFVIEANAAAEAFFGISRSILLQQTLANLLPHRLGPAGARRAGEGEEFRHHRISRRSRHPAARNGKTGRSFRHAGVRFRRGRRGDDPGTRDGGEDGPSAHPSWRGAVGLRHGGDARARDQESSVGHSRRGTIARNRRRTIPTAP